MDGLGTWEPRREGGVKPGSARHPLPLATPPHPPALRAHIAHSPTPPTTDARHLFTMRKMIAHWNEQEGTFQTQKIQKTKSVGGFQPLAQPQARHNNCETHPPHTEAKRSGAGVVRRLCVQGRACLGLGRGERAPTPPPVAKAKLTCVPPPPPNTHATSRDNSLTADAHPEAHTCLYGFGTACGCTGIQHHPSEGVRSGGKGGACCGRRMNERNQPPCTPLPRHAPDNFATRLDSWGF